ncbi:hypothetical protein ACQUQP_19570 [Marinobacterium sp. YM272]|uniref:hypothetical protein n=1 Tax=Marinobacterium sp. YM272 TaxID=3421654 RepID=UPI003D7F190F
MQTPSKLLNQVLAALLLLMLSSVTLAELAPVRIEAYIDSLTDVRELGDQLKAEGKEAFLAGKIMPGAGERFDPHQRAVSVLKRDEPGYYAELGKRVVPRGFTSAESWARTGDQVVLAYGAAKVAAESPQMLALAAQSGPEQELLMQALPPKQREQFKQALVIARALAQVPAADREAVTPYVGQLDQIFNQYRQ